MSLVVRPLALGPPGPLVTPDPAAERRLRELAMDPERGPDPRARLVAEQDGQTVGWARVDVLHSQLHSLIELGLVGEVDPLEHGAALIRAMLPLFAGGRLEAALWHRHSPPWTHALLSRPLPEGAFELYIEKLYVRRSLEDFRSPYPVSFALVSLEDAGEAAFIEALGAALSGSPARDLRATDPVFEFSEMRALEGDTHEPDWWKIALLDGEPAGVILGNRFAGDDDEGTFTFIGLSERLRGRGLGPPLHALGLELLAERGVRRYLCSTDVRNTPMLRLYAKHGCQPFDIRRQYLWRPAPAATDGR